MPVSKDAVAAILSDLATQAEGFQIDVEEIARGHGVPEKRSKRRGTPPVPRSHCVTAEKLRDAARRLMRGHVHGPLDADVQRVEVSYRLVIVFTDSHRVIVRGR